MPAIVDHNQRRAALAQLAADVIAEQGIDAATVRGIAEAAGFSTKIVSHYFADKRTLLLATYRFAADHSGATAAASQADGRADAPAYVASLLPTSPLMLRNWKVWFAFWGFAISDAQFAAEQRRQVLRARGDVAERLGRDARYAHVPPAARDQAARELVTLVIGVALQAAFDPEDWTAARQTEPILDRLRGLTAQQGISA